MFEIDEPTQHKYMESEKRTLCDGTANWAAKVAITGTGTSTNYTLLQRYGSLRHMRLLDKLVVVVA